jgi:hypothetical protein
MHQRPATSRRISLGRIVSLSLAAGSMAHGQITLNANFDHGSLLSSTVTNASTTTPTIDLVGRDNFYGSGRWRWMYFTATGLANKRPTFRVSDNFAGGGGALNTHPMVYSYDGETWSFFDNGSRANGTFSFSNNSSFTGSLVHVAYAIPYSYGRSVAHAQRVLASPHATPTLSGNTSGVIGLSPGGTDDLGRSIAPRSIYAYRITNTNYAQPKKKFVISTGMHAGETIGTWAYQGLVDWLISNDPRAAVVRAVTDFYCYPTLNPDGRFAGFNRSTVNNPNQDPNGLWNPSLWTNRLDIRRNGEAMMTDRLQTADPVEGFVDFHSTIPAFPNEDFGFIEYEQGDNLTPWWVRFKERAGTVVDVDSTGTSWTSANFAEAFLGARVDITFETQFGRRRNINYYTNLGAEFGKALFDTFRPTDGDTNFDGVVNFADLVTLARNYAQFNGVGWEQGDFDLDGFVGFSDLLGLARNYDGPQAEFISALAMLGLPSVPEPTTAGVLVIAGAFLARRRR